MKNKVVFLNQINKMQITASERLLIRYLAPEDENALFEIYSDKEAMKYRGSKPFESIEEVQQMLQDTNEKLIAQTEFRYAVIEKETNFLIGTFLYKNSINNQCEIGYSIGKAYWKKGYGTELLNLMIPFLKAIGFEYLYAKTKKGNEASFQLLIKNGFKINQFQSQESYYFFELVI